jgi:hypothetical protein
MAGHTAATKNPVTNSSSWFTSAKLVYASPGLVNHPSLFVVPYSF